MKSYSETDVFSEVAQSVLSVTKGMLERLPDPDTWEPRWRCHEVARAVQIVLNIVLKEGGSGAELHVFDGHYGRVEHTWLILLETESSLRGMALLDPYAVGRLPQVQLVDTEQELCAMYKTSNYRTDINTAQVERMVSVFRSFVDEHRAYSNAVRWLAGDDIPADG